MPLSCQYIQLLEQPASVLQLRGDEYLLNTCDLLRRSLPAPYWIQQALCAVGACSAAQQRFVTVHMSHESAVLSEGAN